MSLNIVYPAEKMDLEVKQLFKVTQLVRSMVKLSTPKLMVFSLNLATMNHFLLRLHGDER